MATVFRYFGAHLNWILYALEVQVPIQSENRKVKKKNDDASNNLILQKKNDSRKLEGRREGKLSGAQHSKPVIKYSVKEVESFL